MCPLARFCRVGNFQTLPEFFAAQPTSRFPWFLDQNDVPEEKPLIAQKLRLKRKIFLFCMAQQLIPHTPDLENTRERCIIIYYFYFEGLCSETFINSIKELCCNADEILLQQSPPPPLLLILLRDLELKRRERGCKKINMFLWRKS